MSPWGAELHRELYARYAGEVAALKRFDPLIPAIGKTFSGEDRRTLYLMTRHVRPSTILEFSPKRGWSTLHMAAALEANGAGQIVSFELDPLHAWVARRTLRRASLGHRARFVVGDVREELPRVYGALRRAGALDAIPFLFIDSDHSAAFARWYLDALFPLVARDGMIHVHDVQADPRRTAAGEQIFPEPTGEERVLARYLVDFEDSFRWFSVRELAGDEAHLAAIRPHGGGDVALAAAHPARHHPVVRTLGVEHNASLWIQRRAGEPAAAYPEPPFEPLRRRPLEAARYRVKRAVPFLYGPIRELRRSIHQRAQP